jgi:DNA-binding Lrp family transcriptional regulator
MVKNMLKETSISNKKADSVLKWLIKDPTKSVREVAKKLGSYRQRVWREKKKLEDDGVIWGYTAIVDESRMNFVLYITLLKMKPMSKELVELIVGRVQEGKPETQNVRLINVLYVNGEYDWIIMFSAPDHAMARRYYDSLRLAYEEYLLEKPVIIDVNFPLVREGKINPKIKQLYSFVPT